MMRLGCWFPLLLLLPAPARAGLYYSGETMAELPAQWRGFLVDQRSLRTLALPPAPGLPPSPLQTEYKAALAGLEKKANPTADDLADLGALYVRLGQVAKAVEVLRPAQRKYPDHFRLAANLGTGPDLVMGWYDDPHIYPQRLVDVSDLAEDLGKRLGWYDVARAYGFSKTQKHWIGIPIGETRRFRP